MRKLQEKIEICQKQELKIFSLKEDLDKITTQLKTNSKIEKNIEESKSSIVKEEKANSNILFSEDPMINKNQEKLLLR